MILDDPNDAALLDEIRQLVQSKYWKLVRVYLLNRRAQLFAQEHTAEAELWKWHGALREVNRLLYAPEQALMAMAKDKIEGEPLPEELGFTFNGSHHDG